jgi:trehalose 6-phosphate synthase
VGRLVIVSNRVAVPGERAARAGGLAAALRDLLRRRHGLWFGWSGRTAEATDAAPKLVSRADGTFATIDLAAADFDDYYGVFANGTLWPLFHYQLAHFEFHRPAFDAYRRVNAAFARALAPLLAPDDLVWIHDYHLIPLAGDLRRLGAVNRTGFFLHTPFPSPEVLLYLPVHQQVVRDLLEFDLIGFQTDCDVRAFCGYVENEAGGAIAPDGTVAAMDRNSRAVAFPISVDVDDIAAGAASAAASPEARRLAASLSGRALLIGVDRLDYSKGLPQRFKAYRELLANHAERRNKVVFLQIAPISRGDLADYRTLRRELDQLAGSINGRFAEFDWTPIRYVNKSFSRHTVVGFYRLARVGVVTPLRDGMNLVAKEYVAAQDPADPGALVLSRFAGAAAEMDGALVVNPFDIEQVSLAMQQALAMPDAERRERWATMMAALRRNTVATWADNFLARLAETSPSATV